MKATITIYDNFDDKKMIVALNLMMADKADFWSTY